MHVHAERHVRGGMQSRQARGEGGAWVLWEQTPCRRRQAQRPSTLALRLGSRRRHGASKPQASEASVHNSPSLA